MNITISVADDVAVTDAGTPITLLVQDGAGAPGANGVDGADGADGVDGVSVQSAEVDGSGHLILTLTDLTEVDAGYVVGPQGEHGTDGADGADGRGIVSVVRTAGTGAAGTTDTYTITYTDATTSVFYVYNGADGLGSGDMLKSVYDPDADGLIAFAQLSGVAAASHNHTGTYQPVMGADDNYVTDAEKAALHSHSNKTALDVVSGVNTGDQDLSGYSLTSHNHSLANLVEKSYNSLTDKPSIPSVNGLLDETAHDALDHAGLTGVLALGTTGTTACAGNDARLSDARTPTSHTTGSHSDWPAAVSMTEVGYLDGVTSSIQTQLNGKQASGTYVTSVTGTAPIVSSGGVTPAISLPAATTSASGYLTSTDWNAFNGKAAANQTFYIGTTQVAINRASAALTLAGITLTTPDIGTPTAGNLYNCTVDGTNKIGFLNIPQNIQSTEYTCVLADAGKQILHPSADTTARTFTIPANSSVAYPIGTAITFINQVSAGTLTIAITTDTMRLAGAGTTGSRTLAANGVATAIKLTSTEWIISGSGLT